MEDWQFIGSTLEKLCNDGFFPAIGYDASGWSAWAFLDAPIEGDLFGDYVKAYGDTATEAVRNLIHEIEAVQKIEP
jgi:hypothetical protein